MHGASPAPDLERRLEVGLGISFLPTVFILLADYERYLRAATEAFLARPPDAIDEHGQAIRRIGSEAAALLVERPWRVGASARSIDALIEGYNRANPPSLLFTLFLSPAPTKDFRVMEPPLPAPTAQHDDALADIDACHGNFKLPAFWRELAADWPEHAASAWELVRRLPDRDGFARARAAVRSRALQAIGGGGAPTPAELGCAPGDGAEIAKILSFYAVVIPTMVVEIECLRHARALGAGELEQ